MAHSKSLRALVVSLAVAALVLTALPAWALPNAAPPLPGAPRTSPNTPPPLVQRGTVPANVSVAGHDLGGLTEAQARTLIYAYVRPSDLPTLTVVAGDRTLSLSAASAFVLDADAMLAQAYAAGGADPMDLTPRFIVSPLGVRSFVSYVAARTDVRMLNSLWYVSGKRLKLQASAVGQRLDSSAARWILLDALKAEARTGAAQPPVTLPVKVLRPRITEKNVGRAILVVVSERYLRLYDPANGGYILHGYNCAVGQPAYPTPIGTFRIVEKRYMPTWVNPGSDWGRGMPPYIAPGPGNPLGTRALNLSADGIRIHGTENIGSIGTAASHGCIRMLRRDIEQLYDLVVVGTPVFIVR
ncbi:MAG TPA: L,D-transpeptidase [Coriobacteriia bacterium]